MELLPSLISELKANCAAFPDPRQGRTGNIAMADFGLSAFAMFFMQSVSFLAFQRRLEIGNGRSNCQTLFGITKISSDNHIRKMLDGVDPALLLPSFRRIEQLLAERDVREAFGRLGGRPLVAWDGTQYFRSEKLGCANCLTCKHSNGKVDYYHTLLAATVVAPGHSKVIPLFPEFIATQDGAEKQDCERNAARRWYEKHGSRLRTLRPVYLGDDLFACQPVAAMVKDNGDDFIFTCKNSSHKALYDFMAGAEPERLEVKVRKRNSTETRRYRWFEGVPLRDGKDAMLVNWIGMEIVDAKGKVKFTCAWVTSLFVSKYNVAEIADAGRARWKIENESFNVLKNHGYELEHNFGHGEKFLAMMLAALNLLAFAWHSVLDLIEPPWLAAREKLAKRTTFFGDLLTLTSYVVFPSWQVLLEAINTSTIPPELLKNQKIE
jgi:hypothetical protein